MTAELVRCWTDAEILKQIYSALFCGALIGFVLGRFWK